MSELLPIILTTIRDLVRNMSGMLGFRVRRSLLGTVGVSWTAPNYIGVFYCRYALSKRFDICK
ncbi:hypothetical protein DSLPV1_001 [Dishui lake phycodnavirus 1]|uniref:hypothetical protein n=1 Tax=Dishui lake phycodnavirus 1 TaxID=2079134 RepID=UPI000CD6B16E|nr:hypothetical protein C5Y57_gp001 [Dishui lake phycodnavirus 1]AUT18972.1 hypothetical protein DSLPV1_001 [Dishui lake phycodnavirus 1]